jgi:hypothetical protein
VKEKELHVQEWVLYVMDVFDEELHKMNTAQETWLEMEGAEIKTEVA